MTTGPTRYQVGVPEAPGLPWPVGGAGLGGLRILERWGVWGVYISRAVTPHAEGSVVSGDALFAVQSLSRTH